MKLCDSETRQYRDRISHLQFLIDHLEEESLIDTDYYANRTTLQLLKERNELRSGQTHRKRYGCKQPYQNGA